MVEQTKDIKDTLLLIGFGILRDRSVGHSQLKKEEVTKQLKVGFIKPMHQVEWIANVVPIPKKDKIGRAHV